MRENHHVAPEPIESALWCDRCGGYHNWKLDCPVETARCLDCQQEYEVEDLLHGICLSCEDDWGQA